MVFKIRNKGFDIFAAATNPRVHPAKKTKTALDLTRLVTIQVQQTRFTGMRIKHGYRNISRSCKQFLMGDKLLEQCMILSIKHHFFRPMHYKSPIENSFYIVSNNLYSQLFIFLYNFREEPSLTWLIDTTPYSLTTSTQCSLISTNSTTKCLEWHTLRTIRLELMRRRTASKNLSPKRRSRSTAKKASLLAGTIIKTFISRLRQKSVRSITSHWPRKARLEISLTTLKLGDLSALRSDPLNCDE